MTRTARAGQIVLVLLGLTCALVAAGTWFPSDEQPLPWSGQVLVSTFGVAMGILVVGLAIELGRTPSSGLRLVWSLLWVLPVFYLAHVLLLGTWLPDGLFLVLAVAALGATRPVTRRSATALPA